MSSPHLTAPRMTPHRGALLALLGLSLGCIDNPAEKSADTAPPVDSGEPFDPDLDDDGVEDTIDCDPTDPDVVGPRERWADADGDGYGDDAVPGDPACWWEAGWSFTSGDCDDTLAEVHPDATELCNGIDDNCDRLIDDDDPEVFRTDPIEAFVDADEDGHGDPTRPVVACALSTGLALVDTDCDDTNPSIHPDAEEVCGTGIDEDCDGLPGEACGLSALVSESAGLIESTSLESFAHQFTVFNHDPYQTYGAVGFDLYGRGEEVPTLRLYRPVTEFNINSGLWAPTEVEGETGLVQVLGSSEGTPRTGVGAIVVPDFNGDLSRDLILQDTESLSLLEAGQLLPDRLSSQDDVVTWTLPFSADASTDPRWWVNAADDVNADGLSDLIINTDINQTYLLYGQDDWSTAMAACDGTLQGCADVRIEPGDSTLLQSGGERSGTGVDLNGDGFSEAITHVYVPPRGGYMHVLVYDGTAVSAAAGGSLTFDDRDVEMIGPDLTSNGHSLGRVMSHAGDLNQDGYADLFLSEYDAYDPRPRVFAGSADWLTREDWSGGAATPTLEDASLVIDHTDTIDRFSQVSDAEAEHDVTGDGRSDLVMFFPPYTGNGVVVVVPAAEGWDAVAEGEHILASIPGNQVALRLGTYHHTEKGLSELIVPTGTVAPGVLLFSVPGL